MKNCQLSIVNCQLIILNMGKSLEGMAATPNAPACGAMFQKERPNPWKGISHWRMNNEQWTIRSETVCWDASSSSHSSVPIVSLAQMQVEASASTTAKAEASVYNIAFFSAHRIFSPFDKVIHRMIFKTVDNFPLFFAFLENLTSCYPQK